MHQLNFIELYDRGLKDFKSLSSLERDVFVINDLDVYYEMEGGFEDYLLSGGHEPQLSWLTDTLLRIGDKNSLHVISQLKDMDDSQRDDMRSLCDRFYYFREDRWNLLKAFLATHNTEILE